MELRLQKPSLGYAGTPVLHDIDLCIKPGEKVSLLGRSGAGKSTLLKAFYAQSETRAALIPQDTALVQTLSVFHNVYMGRLHQHSTWANLRNLIRPAPAQIDAMLPLLKQLRLESTLRTAVGELSGGQRQRVAVARAAHQNRALLLGDEPVSAVDEQQAKEVLTLLCERHHTVVLAMHDVQSALLFSDRIIGLAQGRVALDEAASNLRADDLSFLYQAPRTHGDNALSEQALAAPELLEAR